ncbi:hypothetical protein ACFW22_34895, partial [Streptomyces sp. NPDC058872]
MTAPSSGARAEASRNADRWEAGPAGGWRQSAGRTGRRGRPPAHVSPARPPCPSPPLRSAPVKKILLGATAAAVVAAGTFGVVSANAAAPAAVPAAVAADATGQHTVESTHLTIEAAVQAARATLDAAGAEGQRVSVAVVDRN